VNQPPVDVTYVPQGPPAPPQGPGVVPPFPAPPTEGRRLRIGWGLGIGAIVLVLVCGGGLAAFVGLSSVMSRAINEQAQVVVGNYLSDLQGERYTEAYGSLCPRSRARLTQEEFTSQQMEADPIRDYEVGTLNLANVDLAVPVEVTYADGRTEQLRAFLDQNRETGGFEVCSVEE
jgi:hypothetical protein